MNGDKVLGLHGGYSMACFPAYWDILKEDIMTVFCEWHLQRFQGLLIPKTFAQLLM